MPDLEDLSRELAITPSGLRKRIHALGLGVTRGSRGKWIIPDALATTLRDADDLMKGGAGAATVRRVLGITLAPIPDRAVTGEGADAARTEAGASEESAERDHAVTGESPIPDRVPHVMDMDVIVQAVTAAIANQNDMAERYGKVAFELGESKATIRALELERDRLSDELAREREAHATIRAVLAAPKRPWWRFWA